MARPTTTGLQGTPGYGPRQQGATQQAGVYAPLDVRVGPSGAEQLANALGLAVETVTPAIKQQVFEKARDQTTQGMLDAQNGAVDAKRAAEDEYYERGQRKVLTDRATLDAINEWQQRYDTGEVQKTSVEAVRADFNAFMQQRLASLVADPEGARWALEKLGPFQAKVLGDLQKQQAAEFQADAIATAGESARLAVKTGQPIDLEGLKASLVASGLNRADAVRSLVNIVGQTAIETKNPELLDATFTADGKWADGTPGPRATPELLKEINEARYYASVAQKAQDREIKEAAEKAAAADVAEASILAAGGDYGRAKAILDPLIRSGAIERSEYFAILNAGRGAIDFIRQETVDPAAIAEWRTRLMEGKFATPREANAAALALVPGGEQGGRMMQQLADDSTSYFRALENDSNPLTRAYGSDLDIRFKPGEPATTAQREKYAAIRLQFYRDIAAGKSPEDAYERAMKLGAGFSKDAPAGTPRPVGNALVTPLD